MPKTATEDNANRKNKEGNFKRCFGDPLSCDL